MNRRAWGVGSRIFPSDSVRGFRAGRWVLLPIDIGLPALDTECQRSVTGSVGRALCPHLSSSFPFPRKPFPGSPSLTVARELLVVREQAKARGGHGHRDEEYAAGWACPRFTFWCVACSVHVLVVRLMTTAAPPLPAR